MNVTVARSVLDVPAAAWDALVPPDEPFTEHAFLAALERSGCVGAASSWAPEFLLGWDEGRLVAGAPAWRRTDSYGEYIFDWGWADGARRAGIRYYPKRTVAVPFTPASGARLLGARGLAATLHDPALSSTHVLFCTEAEQEALAAEGWLARLSLQFHWQNPGWRDWQDFLDAFTSKRRKELLRERRQVQDAHIRVEVRRGPELEEADWDALHAYYRDTIARHGQIAYLRPAFWTQLREALAHRVVAVLAWREGRRIAGALNFTRGRHLYGRYWGAVEEHRGLHFEVCYHALVDWSLQNGITRFEAGAQGEHKLQRGFLPVLTRSAHRVSHPGLAAAVARFVEAEAAHVRAAAASYAEHGPFRAAGVSRS